MRELLGSLAGFHFSTIAPCFPLGSLANLVWIFVLFPVCRVTTTDQRSAKDSSSGSGLAKPSDGPCELRFDYIYFTASTLKLQGVHQVLSKSQFDQIFGEPYETLPNSWHPSDHLPVVASFEFREA